MNKALQRNPERLRLLKEKIKTCFNLDNFYNNIPRPFNRDIWIQNSNSLVDKCAMAILNYNRFMIENE